VTEEIIQWLFGVAACYLSQMGSGGTLVHFLRECPICIADQAATMTGEEAVGYLSCLLSTSMHAQDHALFCPPLKGPFLGGTKNLEKFVQMSQNSKLALEGPFLGPKSLVIPFRKPLN